MREARKHCAKGRRGWFTNSKQMFIFRVVTMPSSHSPQRYDTYIPTKYHEFKDTFDNKMLVWHSRCGCPLDLR